MDGRGLTRLVRAVLLIRQRPEDLGSISGSNRSQALHLGFIRRCLRLGWHWEAMRDTIPDAFEASGERHEALLAAIALALDFQTWRTLVRVQGPDDGRAVHLLVGMARCLMHT
jgi:hypothetical protein